MKIRFSFFIILALGIAFITGGCNSDKGGPKALLDKYFSSAIKQDYATTYACYYATYKTKISVEEYLKHRKEASVLQSYKILSLNEEGDTARAEALLTFASSEKLQRKEPVTTTVKEELIKEKGEWKIKVW